jgi:hypothetical protein
MCWEVDRNWYNEDGSGRASRGSMGEMRIGAEADKERMGGRE